MIIDKDAIDITKELHSHTDFYETKGKYILDPEIILNKRFDIQSIKDIKLRLKINDLKYIDDIAFFFFNRNDGIYIPWKENKINAKELKLDGIKAVSLIMEYKNTKYVIYDRELKHKYSEVFFAAYINPYDKVYPLEDKIEEECD